MVFSIVFDQEVSRMAKRKRITVLLGLLQNLDTAIFCQDTGDSLFVFCEFDLVKPLK